MPRALLKCSKCKRTFKMPAHLARHMNTIHGGASSRTRSKTAAKGKRRAGRKLRGRVGRPPKSASTWAGEFGATTRLLSDIRAFHNDLLSRRHSLDAEIDGLAKAMDVLGGSPRRTRTKARRSTGRTGKPGRPRSTEGREGSLKSYIVRVLKQNSKPLSPNDIGARVVKAGFKTKAKDITKAVSNTLPQLSNVKRTGFGMYQIGR